MRLLEKFRRPKWLRWKTVEKTEAESTSSITDGLTAYRARKISCDKLPQTIRLEVARLLIDVQYYAQYGERGMKFVYIPQLKHWRNPQTTTEIVHEQAFKEIKKKPHKYRVKQDTDKNYLVSW